jgi:tight adherence protein B
MEFWETGAIDVEHGVYVTRRADSLLLSYCASGQLCYILTARQMGKSSMKNNIMRKLVQSGYKCVSLDLQSLDDKTTDIDFYNFLISRCSAQLELPDDSITRLKWNSSLPANIQFQNFLRDVVCAQVQEKIVLFFDEVERTADVNLAENFFSTIRSIYDERSRSASLQRISFVLIGSALPNELIRDTTKSPFNIGKRVHLSDFSIEEAMPLAAAIGISPEKYGEVLQQVFAWTDGQPYLTHVLCRKLSETRLSTEQEIFSAEEVENICRDSMLGGEFESNHLQYLGGWLSDEKNGERVLRSLGYILEHNGLPDNPHSPVVQQLKLRGWVKVKNGQLVIRNRVYCEYFNRQYIIEALRTIHASDPEDFKKGEAYVVRKSASSVPIHPARKGMEGLSARLKETRLVGYVERAADKKLFDNCLNFEWSIVSGAPQTGKTHLMINTLNRLVEQGFSVAAIDLQWLDRDTLTDKQRAYNFLYEIADQLGRPVGFNEWWEKHENLGFGDCLENLLSQFLRTECLQAPVVVFVDGIKVRRRWKMDDWFLAFRSIYNARSQNEVFANITFVFLGCAFTSDFIQSKSITPFNIGSSITLGNFFLDEMVDLIKEVHPNSGEPEEEANSIYLWTGGQPGMSAMISEAFERGHLSTSSSDSMSAQRYEFLAGKHIIQFEIVLADASNWLPLDLTLRDVLYEYVTVLLGKTTASRGNRKVERLGLVGLIVQDQDEIWKPANRIYETHFTREWVSNFLSTVDGLQPADQEKQADQVSEEQAKGSPEEINFRDLFSGLRLDESPESKEQPASEYDLYEEEPKPAPKRDPLISQWVNERVSRSSFRANISRDLTRADLNIKPVEYVALIILSAIGLGFVSWYISGHNHAIFTWTGVLIGTFLPIFYVRVQQNRRLVQFKGQLGDMLMLMVSGLQSGYSVMQAMEAVSKELPSPICDEFRRVVQEMQLGVSMQQALDHLQQRIPDEDLGFVVTAINIQREVGGNIAEMLDTVRYSLGERARIQNQIQIHRGRKADTILFLCLLLSFVQWSIFPGFLKKR